MSPRSMTAAEPEFGENQLAGRVQWHRVSSVTCHMTWRVVEMEWAINVFNKMQGAIGFFNEKETFYSDCVQKPAIRVG